MEEWQRKAQAFQNSRLKEDQRSPSSEDMGKFDFRSVLKKSTPPANNNPGAVQRQPAVASKQPSGPVKATNEPPKKWSAQVAPAPTNTAAKDQSDWRKRLEEKRQQDELDRAHLQRELSEDVRQIKKRRDDEIQRREKLQARLKDISAKVNEATSAFQHAMQLLSAVDSVVKKEMAHQQELDKVDALSLAETKKKEDEAFAAWMAEIEEKKKKLEEKERKAKEEEERIQKEERKKLKKAEKERKKADKKKKKEAEKKKQEAAEKKEKEKESEKKEAEKKDKEAEKKEADKKEPEKKEPEKKEADKKEPEKKEADKKEPENGNTNNEAEIEKPRRRSVSFKDPIHVEVRIEVPKPKQLFSVKKVSSEDQSSEEEYSEEEGFSESESDNEPQEEKDNSVINL